MKQLIVLPKRLLHSLRRKSRNGWKDHTGEMRHFQQLHPITMVMMRLILIQLDRPLLRRERPLRISGSMARLPESMVSGLMEMVMDLRSLTTGGTWIIINMSKHLPVNHGPGILMLEALEESLLRGTILMMSLSLIQWVLPLKLIRKVILKICLNGGLMETDKDPRSGIMLRRLQDSLLIKMISIRK